MTARRHGAPPYTAALLHGGPGAAGEMAPVARRLAAAGRGVLEPLQTALSVGGQLAELGEALAAAGGLPVTLVGFSWGAWLGWLFAAAHPERVKKLVLVSSPPYEEAYVPGIQMTRLARLSNAQRNEAARLLEALGRPAAAREADALFARLGAVFAAADTCDPVAGEEDGPVDYRADIFNAVWPEVSALRRDGRLLRAGAGIRCPVVAVHGDYDPHPAAGVETPLARTLRNFRFVLLEHCGHKPWIERAAREEFYRVLEAELGPAG